MARETDYVRPIYLAAHVLSEAGITSFPVSLKIILRYYRIRIMTYDQVCQINEISRDECIRQFGKDGATISENNQYAIVYNERQTPADRIRFTLAHELGHIFHRHHQELGTNVLQRVWVEKSLYDVMEDEANCFARNLLCPPVATREILRYHGFVATQFSHDQERNVWVKVKSAPCYPHLPDSLTDFFLVRQAFKITTQAAKARCHFLKDDLNNLLPKDRTVSLNIRFTTQWRCPRCGAPRIDSSKICYNCGAKQQFVFVPKADPPDLPLFIYYTDQHFSSCPFCGNKEHQYDALYCMICGMPAANPCSSGKLSHNGMEYWLQHMTEKNAHLCRPGVQFCTTCRAPTLFNLYSVENEMFFEYLDDDQKTVARKKGDYHTMKYGPAIPYDPVSFKVAKCPKCLYEDHDADAEFCIMCGTTLYNLCDGEYSDFDHEDINRHPNPANARLCRLCGRPTAYSTLPILPSFTEALRRSKDAANKELEEMNVDNELFWSMNSDEGDDDAPATENNATMDFSAVDPNELPF